MLTIDTNKSLVGQGMLFLAGKCDGARALDGHGFGRYDAVLGHDLADRYQKYGSFYGEKQHGLAKKLCIRYRRQLLAVGFDMEALGAESFNAEEGAAARAEREAAREARNGSVIHAVAILAVGDRAYKVTVSNRGTHEWLPKSMVTVLKESGPIHQRNGYKGGTFFTVANISVPRWLAEAKGMTIPALPDQVVHLGGMEAWNAMMQSVADTATDTGRAA